MRKESMIRSICAVEARQEQEADEVKWDSKWAKAVPVHIECRQWLPAIGQSFDIHGAEQICSSSSRKRDRPSEERTKPNT